MIHQLNIVKIIKIKKTKNISIIKTVKKNLMKDIKVFLKKKKKNKQQYGCEWYKSLPEDDKYETKAG